VTLPPLLETRTTYGDASFRLTSTRVPPPELCALTW
jgi:hypothetical protein